MEKFADKARGPTSPRGTDNGSGFDDPKAITPSRRQKLNVLDELLDKMDTLQPSSPALSGATSQPSVTEKKPEKFVVVVRWPDEISGAESYSKVRQ